MSAAVDVLPIAISPVNTGMPLPLERFYFWEKNHPNKICFTQPMGGGDTLHLTWSDVGTQARKVATYLKAQGIEQGDRVAILSKNCAHWIMSDLAIWMAGGVSVPIYPTSNAETVQQILEHSGSKLLFVGKLDTWDAMKQGVPASMKCVSYPLSPKNDFDTWNRICDQNEPLAENPPRTHQELGTIIYTSGTTGTPKGVMHTFGSMAAGAGQASTLYEVSSRDRVLSYLPLSHVAERMALEIVQFYQGTHLFFAESLETFARDLQRCRPTIFFAVPRIWAKFRSGVYEKIPEKKFKLLMRIPFLNKYLGRKILQGLGLDYCRFALSGAAPISADLMEWYQSLGLELLEVYGMTENLGYSHATRRGRSRIGYVGQPNPGVEVRLGENNEILVKSPCTMVGYYKDPEKTAEALDGNGFIHTGDVGSIDDDGALRITGRVKEIFKTSKGKYVAPFPIENHLLANPHVEQVCVVGAGLPQPIAIVMLTDADRALLAKGGGREEITSSLEELLAAVNPKLDAHEKLAALVISQSEWTTENGILTPTLKIKRNVLEAKYQHQLEDYAERRGEVLWESA
ncbi:AMP-binding enzyme [gamma proteobacterium HdN1]|nr:AMP-binding enzyme [gamma proteobacterium HdN1]